MRHCFVYVPSFSFKPNDAPLSISNNAIGVNRNKLKQNLNGNCPENEQKQNLNGFSVTFPSMTHSICQLYIHLYVFDNEDEIV